MLCLLCNQQTKEKSNTFIIARNFPSVVAIKESWYSIDSCLMAFFAYFLYLFYLSISIYLHKNSFLTFFNTYLFPYLFAYLHNYSFIKEFICLFIYLVSQLCSHLFIFFCQLVSQLVNKYLVIYSMVTKSNTFLSAGVEKEDAQKDSFYTQGFFVWDFYSRSSLNTLNDNHYKNAVTKYTRFTYQRCFPSSAAALCEHFFYSTQLKDPSLLML